MFVGLGLLAVVASVIILALRAILLAIRAGRRERNAALWPTAAGLIVRADIVDRGRFQMETQNYSGLVITYTFNPGTGPLTGIYKSSRYPDPVVPPIAAALLNQPIAVSWNPAKPSDSLIHASHLRALLPPTLAGSIGTVNF